MQKKHPKNNLTYLEVYEASVRKTTKNHNLNHVSLDRYKKAETTQNDSEASNYISDVANFMRGVDIYLGYL